MNISKQGVSPIRVKWTVVRGDTASIRVDFLNRDETTHWDTEGWSYEASAYDALNDSVESLEVSEEDGYVVITAPSDITEAWGAGFGAVIGEVQFDLKVTMQDDTVWTPIIGTIAVSGNVSGDF